MALLPKKFFSSAVSILSPGNLSLAWRRRGDIRLEAAPFLGSFKREVLGPFTVSDDP